MSNRNLVEASLSAVSEFEAGRRSMRQLRQVVGQAVEGLELVPGRVAEELRTLLWRLEVEESYAAEDCETELLTVLDRLRVLLRKVLQSP